MLFAWFLMRQRRSRAPLMPLSLFSARNFAWGNLATLFIYAALSLNGFVIGVYLQEGPGLPATAAGLASLPITILMILLSSQAGAWAGKLGPRLFMTAGPLLMAAGALLLLTVTDDFSYWWQVLPSMIMLGLGLSLTVAPLTSAVLGAIDENRSGIASAVNNAISRVAGLIVVAMLSTIVGGTLDLNGFHSAALVTASLMAAGGIVSWIGIRKPAAPIAPPRSPERTRQVPAHRPSAPSSSTKWSRSASDQVRSRSPMRPSYWARTIATFSCARSVATRTLARRSCGSGGCSRRVPALRAGGRDGSPPTCRSAGAR